MTRIWEIYDFRLQDLLREQQQPPSLDDSDDPLPPAPSEPSSDRPPPVAEATPANRSPTNNPVVRSRRPSRRPDLRSLSPARAAAVKHARRAPPNAARSVLDGREHDGIISAVGRHPPQSPRRLYAGPHRRQQWVSSPPQRPGEKVTAEAGYLSHAAVTAVSLGRIGLRIATLTQGHIAMTDDRIAIQSLLEKSSDASLLREMIGFAAQRLMVQAAH